MGKSSVMVSRKTCRKTSEHIPKTVPDIVSAVYIVYSNKIAVYPDTFGNYNPAGEYTAKCCISDHAKFITISFLSV